ncbi:hypothetical protein MHYP_G00097380 [Metynnis hypsauchen]
MVHYRKLNDLTLKDAYPRTNIEECLDTLESATVFSTLDLQSGYWQVEVRKQDCCKTTFITTYGLFEYKQMPFGLCNAPTTFQRAMEVALRGLQCQNLLIYLDDVIVLGKDIADSLKNLEVVFKRISPYGLKLKPTKCHLLKEEVLFLAHIISGEGIRPNPKLIQDITDLDRPKTLSELQVFLALCNYYCHFVKSFSQICSPLHELQKKDVEFHWGEAQEAAFSKLKNHLTTAPILVYPTSQVFKFTRQFGHYLLGCRLLIRTDHSSLSWLFCFKHPEGHLARWLEELGQYDMQIEHRPGVRHGNADALTRKVADSQCNCYKAGKDISTLSYGGCAHCQRMQQQWARFETDVVPLAVRHVTKCKETRIVENSASQVKAVDSSSSPENLNNKSPRNLR